MIEKSGKAVRWRYGDRWLHYPRYSYGKVIHRCEGLVGCGHVEAANDALVTRKKRGHIDPENRAMLAGALYCPDCEDSPMYRIMAAGCTFNYYRCTGRGSQPGPAGT